MKTERDDMMKKTAMLLCAMMLLAGCAETEKKQDTVTTAAVNNYEKKADDTVISGEITAITGNEITLALGEIGGPSERPDMTSERPGRNSEGKTDMPSDGDEKRPERSSERTVGNSGSGMTSPDDISGGSERKRSGKRNSSVKKTGEEQTFIIPVGMPIDGLSGRKTDYSGLSVGMAVTLTINSEGTVCKAEIG